MCGSVDESRVSARDQPSGPISLYAASQRVPCHCRPLSGEAIDVSEVKWVTEPELVAMELRTSMAQVARKGLAPANKPG